MNLPKLDQYVTDFAGVLDQATLDQLNQSAFNYENTSGHQFVAVLIPDRQWKELFDISLNIFNTNQIGQEDVNNGLLLVIATDEKKIRIMVGYGLEGEMPDVLASKIIEEDIRPLVNSWDYAGAVRVFYDRSQQAISSGEWKAMQPLDDIDGNESLLFIVALFAYFLGKSARSLKKEKSKKRRSSLWMTGLISVLVLITAVVTIGFLIPLFIYLAAMFFGYVAPGMFLFFPRTGGGFGKWWFGGGGGFGGFSGGGGFSWGGGAGD